MEFGGHVFQQTVGIPMDTNCAPLVTDLFLYSYMYEAEFVQHLQKSKFKEQTTSFNITFRYIDDVLSLNNPKFNDYIDVLWSNDFGLFVWISVTALSRTYFIMLTSCYWFNIILFKTHQNNVILYNTGWVKKVPSNKIWHYCTKWNPFTGYWSWCTCRFAV